MVYKFECDMCDADYVGYTTRHLHQRINEHKYPAIGSHLEEHGLSKTDLDEIQFSVLKKCRSKFNCLIFEMLFRKTLFAPNSLRDSACEYLIALSSHIFAFYSCLLGIHFAFMVVSTCGVNAILVILSF